MDSGEETEVTPQGKCIQGTIHMWIVEKETDGRNTEYYQKFLRYFIL